MLTVAVDLEGHDGFRMFRSGSLTTSINHLTDDAEDAAGARRKLVESLAVCLTYLGIVDVMPACEAMNGLGGLDDAKLPGMRAVRVLHAQQGDGHVDGEESFRFDTRIAEAAKSDVRAGPCLEAAQPCGMFVWCTFHEQGQTGDRMLDE